MTVLNNTLATTCKMVPLAVRELPYPGESARFKYEGTHHSVRWEMSGKKTEEATRDVFRSVTKDSLITVFTVSKSLRERTSIALYFDPSYFKPEKNAALKIQEYFKQFGLNFIPPTLENAAREFVSKTPEELVIVFNILAKNNFIPEPHFTEMRSDVMQDISSRL